MDDPIDNPPRQGAPDAGAPSQPGGAGREDTGDSLSFLQIVGSTLAAAFGVQSSRNRERDFSRGRVSHFIVAGIVFTVVFVLAVIVVVRLVLGSVGT